LPTTERTEDTERDKEALEHEWNELRELSEE